MPKGDVFMEDGGGGDGGRPLPFLLDGEEDMQTEENIASGFYRGTCPDPKCGFEIFFPKHLPGVVCSSCGKRHEPSALKDLKTIKGDTDSVLSAVRHTLINAIKPRKGTDNIKVRHTFIHVPWKFNPYNDTLLFTREII
jgi:hypothetical protein